MAGRPGWMVGVAVLATGLVVLGVAVDTTWALVHDPSAHLAKYGTPFATSTQGPTASFRWASHGYNLTVTDTSSDNGSTIVNWTWSFGDGNTSYAEAPSVHTYTVTCPSCTENVSLAVRDAAGDRSGAMAQVQLARAGAFSGASRSSSQVSLPSIGGWVTELPTAVELLLVLFLIAGALLGAAGKLFRREEDDVEVPVLPRTA